MINRKVIKEAENMRIDKLWKIYKTTITESTEDIYDTNRNKYDIKVNSRNK